MTQKDKGYELPTEEEQKAIDRARAIEFTRYTAKFISQKRPKDKMYDLGSFCQGVKVPDRPRKLKHRTHAIETYGHQYGLRMGVSDWGHTIYLNSGRGWLKSRNDADREEEIDRRRERNWSKPPVKWRKSINVVMEDDLPKGWTKRKSSKSGKWYYANLATRKIQFRKPIGNLRGSPRKELESEKSRKETPAGGGQVKPSRRVVLKKRLFKLPKWGGSQQDHHSDDWDNEAQPKTARKRRRKE